MTTNLGINLEQYFNLYKEEEPDFNDAIGSYKDIKDENLQLVSKYFQPIYLYILYLLLTYRLLAINNTIISFILYK